MRSAGGWNRRWKPLDDAAKRGQEDTASWVVLQELEIGLSRVAGELGREAEQPEPEALGLGAAPGTGKSGGAERMQDLVGKDTQAPEEGVAVEVIDGGASQTELAEFGDALFDDGSLVVASPGGEGMDALDVGEDMRGEGHLVGIELQEVLALKGSAGLEGEEPCTPEGSRGGPELEGREDGLALGRTTPGRLVVLKPSVGGDLEEVVDLQTLESLDHGLAEEALVQTHGDVLDAESLEAAHEGRDPGFGSLSGVGVAGSPEHAEAVASALQIGQQGMMGGASPLLGVETSLSTGLLEPIAHDHRGVEDERLGLRRTPCRRPPPTHHVPEEFVEQGHEHGAGPTKPAAEDRGVGYPDPAEQASDAPALEQGKVVEDTAAIEQEHDPHLDHETRPEEPSNPSCALVDHRAEAESVPESPDEDQSAPVRQIAGAVAQAERRGGALYVGPGIDTMVAHRLGASLLWVTSRQKSPQRKASGGVFHVHTTV